MGVDSSAAPPVGVATPSATQPTYPVLVDNAHRKALRAHEARRNQLHEAGAQPLTVNERPVR